MKCNKDYRLAYTREAKNIVSGLSLEEKVALMGGNQSFEQMLKVLNEDKSKHYNYIPYEAGGLSSAGVPPMKFCDGPRGVVCGTGKTTCFPVSMCRGASFDTELEEKIGRAIGREVRGFGGNLFAGVCINLPYHPGWGRSQETYGEESFHLGQMGAALVRGVQDENVIACVKHYAFNQMEISRFKVDVDCEKRTEREVFLPHFKDCIDAGAASVMSAYNLYRGTYCGHNRYLLNQVLKKEWDFDGFVISDFIWGVRDTVEAANGGQDIEMPATQCFGEKLVTAVKDGFVSEKTIDEAAVRIVRTLLAFDHAMKEDGKCYDMSVVGCEEHRALALQSAREGITLLKNENQCLPMKKEPQTIAVIGPLADKENIGDHGSSQVYPAYVVTPLQGLKRIAPKVNFVYCDGSNPEEARSLAAGADAAIFVVGYNHDDEGEYVSENENDQYLGATGGDRRVSLGLHRQDVELIEGVAAVCKKSAVVLIGGNTIMLEDWASMVDSIIMAYYPGMEGGTAIAEILFGDVNPSGKLPFVIPVSESDLPTVTWDTENQYYGYYHGYAKLEKEGKEPLLPYGFGLSYTSFEISDPVFECGKEIILASCLVKNTGDRKGTQTLQMYIGFENSKVDRPVKLLRGFQRVDLLPGETRRVIIECPVDKLAWYDPMARSSKIEAIEYQVYIGTSSDSKDLLMGKVSF